VSNFGENAYRNRKTGEYSACDCCVELLLANGIETVHDDDSMNREDNYSTNTTAEQMWQERVEADG
jgi:hypothetical protein